MERRRDPQRRRTLKSGTIVFNSRNSTMDCVVRNVTDSGARLEMPSTVGVPDTFDLKIGDGSATRRCTVRWRRDSMLGVEFTD